MGHDTKFVQMISYSEHLHTAMLNLKQKRGLKYSKPTLSVIAREESFHEFCVDQILSLSGIGLRWKANVLSIS